MLHEFMLKYKHDIPSQIKPLHDKYPSGLFSYLDIQTGLIKINDINYDIHNKDELPSYKRNRVIDFYHLLKKMNAKGTVYFDMDDCRQTNAGKLFFGKSLNIFQYNRTLYDDSAILWRLNSYFEPSERIGHISQKVADEIRFQDKYPKVYWRGALSGSRYITPFLRQGPYSLNSIESLELNTRFFSRIKSVFFSRQNNDFTDFKLSCNHSKNLIPEIESNGLWGTPVTPDEMVKYKYLWCPNGNDVSSNLYWILSTNSVAFKENCQHECVADYFIKPWIHYIPITSGLEDLHEKYIWCERNPSKCLEIIDNAKIAFNKMINAKYWEANEMIVLDRLGLL
ncbi:hypothetical protein QF003_002666 [Leclercia adecarboxylata]